MSEQKNITEQELHTNPVLGFVVDSDSDEDEDDLDDNSENSWCDDGSELGYEEYEYSDEDE